MTRDEAILRARCGAQITHPYLSTVDPDYEKLRVSNNEKDWWFFSRRKGKWLELGAFKIDFLLAKFDTDWRIALQDPVHIEAWAIYNAELGNCTYLSTDPKTLSIIHPHEYLVKLVGVAK